MSQATNAERPGWALNHLKEGGNGAYFEMHMRLGLKAQNQSRARIETLAEIKNPRQVAFVKQANTSQAGIARSMRMGAGVGESTSTSAVTRGSETNETTPVPSMKSSYRRCALDSQRQHGPSRPVAARRCTGPPQRAPPAFADR